MKFNIGINSDLGESFGNYKCGKDEEVLKYISSANIACGFHAGDPSILSKTIIMAKRNNVKIGAHLGYPDLLGFGRRAMEISKEDLQNYIVYQLGAISAFLKLNGLELQHVKPHGAMMHFFEEDIENANILADIIFRFNKDLIIVGISGGEVIKAARSKGLKYAEEIYADRAYQSNGKLVPRSKKNAIVSDKNLAVRRVLRMIKEGKVETEDGIDIKVKADTICVHGDTEFALDFVKLLRSEFKKNDIEVMSMSKLLR